MDIVNNFYISRVIYIIIVVSIGSFIINYFSKSKQSIKIKNFDIFFLFRMICLSFALRILIEQIILFINIIQTEGTILNNNIEFIVEFITTCIFAPIFEEIIFRYGLYHKINKKFNYLLSILLTSTIFSLVHSYNIDGVIILFVISIIWNYSYYKTKNLLYPILLHFVHNLYAIISNINFNNIIYIIFGFICLICYSMLSLKKQKK